MNNTHFASIWGNAVSISENHPASYGKDITFCYPVTSPFAGDAVRITLDNYCGLEAVSFAKATILHNNKFYPLFFNGKRNVAIEAEKNAVSDELLIDVKSGDKLEVRFYIDDFTSLRSSVYICGQYSDDAYYAIGDQTEADDISIDIKRQTNTVYFLSNVSLRTAASNRTVVCYGDSITAQDWPDDLQRRCFDEGFDHTAIIRRATSGSRILREYHCIRYESYGLMGEKRFNHEVPTDGADTVIIQQGINDIIHPVGTDVNPYRPMSDLPTVDELIEGIKRYISEARALGYKVYLGTLLPIGGWRTYAPFRDEMRNELNDWMRTTDLADGCIDFDAALRDPANPSSFLPEYDSGDHLHPSKAGYKKMASVIPAEILR